jgi:hypothetical protein
LVVFTDARRRDICRDRRRAEKEASLRRNLITGTLAAGGHAVSLVERRRSEVTVYF